MTFVGWQTQRAIAQGRTEELLLIYRWKC